MVENDNSFSSGGSSLVSDYSGTTVKTSNDSSSLPPLIEHEGDSISTAPSDNKSVATDMCVTKLTRSDTYLICNRWQAERHPKKNANNKGRLAFSKISNSLADEESLDDCLSTTAVRFRNSNCDMSMDDNCSSMAVIYLDSNEDRLDVNEQFMASKVHSAAATVAVATQATFTVASLIASHAKHIGKNGRRARQNLRNAAKAASAASEKAAGEVRGLRGNLLQPKTNGSLQFCVAKVSIANVTAESVCLLLERRSFRPANNAAQIKFYLQLSRKAAEATAAATASATAMRTLTKIVVLNDRKYHPDFSPPVAVPSIPSAILRKKKDDTKDDTTPTCPRRSRKTSSRNRDPPSALGCIRTPQGFYEEKRNVLGLNAVLTRWETNSSPTSRTISGCMDTNLPNSEALPYYEEEHVLGRNTGHTRWQ